MPEEEKETEWNGGQAELIKCRAILVVATLGVRNGGKSEIQAV